MKIRKKEKTAKAKPRSEFRRLKKGQGDERRHPKYVFEKKGSMFSFLSLTHKPPENIKHVKLSNNPNPKDPKPAYISTKVESKKHTAFSKTKVQGLEFSAKDKQIVKKIIHSNKNK